MKSHNKAWDRLDNYLVETRLLGSIQNTLYWDQNTIMPSEGSDWRGDQLSLLAKNLHHRQTCNKYIDLIQEAEAELAFEAPLGNLNESEIASKNQNLVLLKQELRRQTRLDPEWVGRMATAKARGYKLWQHARANSDFSVFSPALRLLISLRKEQSHQLAESRSCWETLAQPYEPDLSKDRLNELFLPLRQKLPDLLEEVTSLGYLNMRNWDIDEKDQVLLCNKLLKMWGRDDHKVVLSRSPHPFSITLGPNDFRLTTRVVKGNPLSCFLSTAHEWGHSLYEQGLPSKISQWFAWPIGDATSMAIHESQSLFWENRIARSKEFAERFWKDFSKVGAPFKSGIDMWKAMNPLSPGWNRVEADELSYGLHILIRTDLEIDLLDNDLEVDDLPTEWNSKYSDLLGITPNNDAEGCLQDVHWSEGQFGYFPSYLLGHLISAQFSESMSAALNVTGESSSDPIGFCISSGKESSLLAWLRKEVHQYGRQMNAEALVEKVTGSTLSSSAFLTYLGHKLERLANAT